nr:uncharacterized protein LOC126547357 isoform X2 [Dermacentor andersoni]
MGGENRSAVMMAPLGCAVIMQLRAPRAMLPPSGERGRGCALLGPWMPCSCIVAVLRRNHGVGCPYEELCQRRCPEYLCEINYAKAAVSDMVVPALRIYENLERVSQLVTLRRGTCNCGTEAENCTHCSSRNVTGEFARRVHFE